MKRANIFFALLCILGSMASVSVAALPVGFQDVNVYDGPDQMVAVRFAADGKMFIAEKRGFILVMPSTQNLAPTTFVDIQSEVVDISDEGMLGLAIHPNFPAQPYVYALYVVDSTSASGPIRTGKVTRWTYNFSSNKAVPGSRVDILNGGWCFAAGDPVDGFGSHAVGDLRFGPDGALYVSGGEGASYNVEDYGQFAVDKCGDPAQQGGALRSQDVQTPADPTWFNGAILRIDPLTGLALASNPFFSSNDTAKRRIIAYGLRNPYRFAVDKNSGELWVTDNGWSNWEELNRIPSPTDATVENFGWPCYEGVGRQAGFDALNLPLCEALYTAGTVTVPTLPLSHTGSDPAYSSSGVDLYYGNTFPAEYQGALFLADIAVGFNGDGSAIRVIRRDGQGNLNISSMMPFLVGGAYPVDLQVGPDGSLYYADLQLNQIHRIEYGGAIAIATANVTSGPVPLAVRFNGSASYDAGGGPVTYSWDLNGDGGFGDSTQASPIFTYTQAGIYTVQLRVTDASANTNIATLTISAGTGATNQPPIITLSAPTPTTTYTVGQSIPFAATAYDPEGFKLPPSAISWVFSLDHCQSGNASNCHEHPIGTMNGIAGGSIVGPDHEFPSFVSLIATATEMPWWDASWNYRSRITLNTAGTTGTLTNFPVLVKLTPATFAYAKAKADGSDLRFIGPANEVLAYEIESWNTSGTSAVWVRATSINMSDSINGFWIYYGNAAAPVGQNPAGVWTENYQAVYHLARNGSAVPNSKSLPNGVIAGSPNQTAGIIGSALAFNGVNDSVNTQITTSLHANDWSVSLWAKLDPSVVCIDGPADDVEGRNLFVKEYDYRIYLKESCQLGFITRRAANDSQNAVWGGTSDTQIFEIGNMPDRQWHHVVYQYRDSANLVEVYFDGVLAGTNVTQTSVLAQSAAFNFGGGGGSQEFFPGLLDDVTIANTSRSPAWITLSHRAGQGTLATLGAEQSRVLTGSPLQSSVSRSVLPQSVNVSFASAPAGMQISIFGRTVATPFVQEMIIGGTATVTATQNQTIGQTEYVFSQWSDGGARSHTITAVQGMPVLTASYSAGNSTTNTTNSTNSTLFTLRVNAGGSQFVDSQGATWVADTPYVVGTSGTYATASAISGTIDDTLFQTERYSISPANGLQYAFAVPNGLYNVSFLFAEIYPGAFSPGARVFDVTAESALVLDDVAVYASVGGNAALTRAAVVNVTDGTLNVRFVHGVENPKISAISLAQLSNGTVVPPTNTTNSTNQTNSTNSTNTTLFALRVNAGGPQYVDPQGATWLADTSYVVGTSGLYSTASAIAATTSDPLYQTERYSISPANGLQYAFAVPNGLYNVSFLFAEIYPGAFANGARVFDVTAENVPVLTGVDVYGQVGGNTAYARSSIVNVTDGVLNVRFVHGVENPKISAIAIQQLNDSTPIVPPPFTPFDLYVNAGGPQFVDSQGATWLADTSYVVGTSGLYSTASAIDGTTSDPLYQTERYSISSVNGLQYSFPVPAGNYSVTLHFAEIYPGAFSSGSRVFDVLLENGLAVDDLDIFTQAGSNTALTRTTVVSVTDDALTVRLAPGIENPKLSAIELHRV